MIERFNDHAANERTYLAWVRTAISIMAFGFLIEKFNIFLIYVSKMAHSQKLDIAPEASISAEMVGLALMLVSVLIIFIATFRFFSYRRSIAKVEKIKYRALAPNILLSVMMLSVAIFVTIYVARQVLLDL
ncbi:MAG: putative membrane protein [Francisellaceae bacterium]|jgi:putative membrane protein